MELDTRVLQPTGVITSSTALWAITLRECALLMETGQEWSLIVEVIIRTFPIRM